MFIFLFRFVFVFIFIFILIFIFIFILVFIFVFLFIFIEGFYINKKSKQKSSTLFGYSSILSNQEGFKATLISETPHP